MPGQNLPVFGNSDEVCQWANCGDSMSHINQHPDPEGKKKKKRHRRLETGQHSREGFELMKRMYDYTCPACGRREPDIKLTRDHIRPVTKGGTSYIENIQPLCEECNNNKQLQVVYYPPPIVANGRMLYS
jgi:5-methylcytosine-specific restriction endonuclease McrA